MRLLSTLPPLLLIPLVVAHGYVGSVTIAGTSYAGNAPGASQPTGSVIREVSTISPVKGSSNEDLNCGMDAEFAQEVAPANPGDKIQIAWVGNGGANVSLSQTFVLLVFRTQFKLVAPQYWPFNDIYGLL